MQELGWCSGDTAEEEEVFGDSGEVGEPFLPPPPMEETELVGDSEERLLRWIMAGL